MTTDDRTGGPALPSEQERANGIWNQTYDPGMTLLDYFAAQFMVRAQSLSEDSGGWREDAAAKCAYDMAEAMIAERARRMKDE